jgi:hypothetical protein
MSRVGAYRAQTFIYRRARRGGSLLPCFQILEHFVDQAHGQRIQVTALAQTNATLAAKPK